VFPLYEEVVLWKNDGDGTVQLSTGAAWQLLRA
jgi:hypothetical protein